MTKAANRRRGSARGGLSLLLLAAPLGLACQAMNTPIYFNGPMLMAVGGEDPTAFNGTKLKFRNPTQKERDALQAQTNSLNYGGDVPWISRDKVHIELSYRITNVSDVFKPEPTDMNPNPEIDPRSGKVFLSVDGASEFAKYDSKTVVIATQDGKEPGVFVPLLSTTPVMLAPGATISGVIREDDFAEAELDLDALVRWTDVDTFTGVLINRADVNPVGLALVPPRLVVPALVGIDVNLQTNVPMKCEYVIRVRDDDDRLFHEEGDTEFEINPTLFVPAAMM